MHKLDRGQAPACLSNYRHGMQNWGDVSPQDKASIWLGLNAMQGHRCAYCEALLSEGKRHIEHFIRKGQNPQLTFQWANLFGSCKSPNSCGTHKDDVWKQDTSLLIKPDVDDPEKYLLFASSGKVSVRTGLNAQDSAKAQHTIDAFNLDEPVLKGKRREAARHHVDTAEFLATCTPDDYAAFLQEELASIVGQAFETTIKHTLMKLPDAA
jgi:uncharacterized protein (TIGR02646 family)